MKPRHFPICKKLGDEVTDSLDYSDEETQFIPSQLMSLPPELAEQA